MCLTQQLFTSIRVKLDTAGMSGQTTLQSTENAISTPQNEDVMILISMVNFRPRTRQLHFLQILHRPHLEFRIAHRQNLSVSSLKVTIIQMNAQLLLIKKREKRQRFVLTT